MKRVQLFYDVISPFSWVGFEVLCRYRSLWKINLELTPFLLGGVQKRVGRREFKLSPGKMQYTMEDMTRTGRHFGIPLRIPKNMNETLFVKGSLPVMRVLTAVKASYPQHLEAVSRQMWLRVWSRDEDIAGREGLMAGLLAAGFDDAVAEGLLEESQAPDVKEVLKRTTETAVELGIFGSPSMVAHVDGRTEMLFGSDRIPLLADVIGEVYEGPLIHLSSLEMTK